MTRDLGELMLHFLPFSSQISLARINALSSPGESLESRYEFSSYEFCSKILLELSGLSLEDLSHLNSAFGSMWNWQQHPGFGTSVCHLCHWCQMSLLQYDSSLPWFLVFIFFSEAIQVMFCLLAYQGSVKDRSIVDRRIEKLKHGNKW